MLPDNSVTAIVPARNEEARIARAVESLAAQPEVVEIIVVNDQSSDRTVAVLSDLGRCFPKLRVLETRSLPTGWVGKNYAAWTGAAEANGHWLLFTDADTLHLPGSTAHALADAETHAAAMVSYSPEQEMRTCWERAIIPFVYCRLAHKFSFDRVNDPGSPDAAANGQYLLIRRDAYNAIGGHHGVAAEVLEDVALARRAKQYGFALHFAAGPGIVRTRMYNTFSEMWHGWTKNLFPLVAGSARAMAGELVEVIPWIPMALLLLGGVSRLLPLLGLILFAGRHAVYGGLLRRNRFPISGIYYYSISVVLYVCLLLASAWNYRRGWVVWKGREYPVGTR